MASGNTHIGEQLNYKALAEIKTMAKPPKLVKQIMMSCCVLVGDFQITTVTELDLTVPDEYWKVIKYSMAQKGFSKRLSELDPSTVPMEFLAAAEKYIGETNKDVVHKVSMSAMYCFIWAKNVIAKAKSNNGEQKSD